MALRRRPERGLLAGLWEYPNELADGSAEMGGSSQWWRAARAMTGRLGWRQKPCPASSVRTAPHRRGA